MTNMSIRDDQKFMELLEACNVCYWKHMEDVPIEGLEGPETSVHHVAKTISEIIDYIDEYVSLQSEGFKSLDDLTEEEVEEALKDVQEQLNQRALALKVNNDQKRNPS